MTKALLERYPAGLHVDGDDDRAVRCEQSGVFAQQAKRIYRVVEHLAKYNSFPVHARRIESLGGRAYDPAWAFSLRQ